MTEANDLIHDWNAPEPLETPARPVAILDDTLRDGLQNASVRKPSLAVRYELLRTLSGLGVECVNLGLPAASPEGFQEILALAEVVDNEKLPLRLVCAGRTLVRDMEPIVELGRRVAAPLEGHCFVGSSQIRMLAEGWTLEEVMARSAQALDVLVRAGIDATFVTEDTTRSEPATLERLFATAIDHGASRLCLCDTVGHATAEGARRLVEFARSVVERSGARVALDWHGHNDRGLALAAALSAVRAGVDRVHATALGIGERVGNTPLELIILNLKLEGLWAHDVSCLVLYCQAVAEAVGWDIPKNYPLLGENAFRTATGVHASAILKARGLEEALAHRVYSGVPADWFGRRQEICVGHMSGASNVTHWLSERGIAASPELVLHVLGAARKADRVLSDEELEALLRDFVPVTG